jgi:hypothetical protein
MRGVDRCGLAAVALLLACLACPCFSEKDPWANDKDTVLIHASNFTEIVSKEKLIMVEFFTPWCGHCRQFAPEYAKAATELKKDGQSINSRASFSTRLTRQIPRPCISFWPCLLSPAVPCRKCWHLRHGTR